MNDQFLTFVGGNYVIFGVVSFVLCVISSTIEGNEASTSRLTKIICRVLDSVGQILMVFAFFGFFCGNH